MRQFVSNPATLSRSSHILKRLIDKHLIYCSKADAEEKQKNNNKQAKGLTGLKVGQVPVVEAGNVGVHTLHAGWKRPADWCRDSCVQSVPCHVAHAALPRWPAVQSRSQVRTIDPQRGHRLLDYILAPVMLQGRVIDMVKQLMR